AGGGTSARSEHTTGGIGRPETLAHDPSPQPAHRAKLRSLLEEFCSGREIGSKPRRELVDRETAIDGPLYVGIRDGDSGRRLLYERAACLAHVVAAYIDKVPAWQAFGAELDNVCDQPE